MDYSSEARRRTRLAAPRAGEIHLVCEVGQAVAGFISAGPPAPGGEGYDAEVYALYVRPELHRAGVGRALLKAAASELDASGKRTLIIWTLRHAASRRFYEAMGGTLVRERHELFRDRADGLEADLDEVAYGWDGLRALAARG
jgi:GNAT superfamily N-acetyltransferase